MDLQGYWTSKTAILEIIIVIFCITTGQTDYCITRRDLDEVPDSKDWAKNGYSGNISLNITTEVSEIYIVLKINGQIKKDWKNSEQDPSFETKNNSLDTACKFKVKQAYQTEVILVDIYAYNFKKPNQCVFLATCAYYREYCQVKVQLNASSIIPCIGVIHIGKKMKKSYQKAALISIPINMTTTYSTNKDRISKSINHPPKTKKDEILCKKTRCTNALDRQCTPRHQPDDISIRSLDKKN